MTLAGSARSWGLVHGWVTTAWQQQQQQQQGVGGYAWVWGVP
jgi:hypothetical protein